MRVLKATKKITVMSMVLVLTLMCTMVPVGAKLAFVNPVLESLFFTDALGNIVLQPEGKNNLIPYVVVSKTEGSPVLANTSTMAVAVYNRNGSMKDIRCFSIAAANSVYNEIAFTVDRWTLKGAPVDFPIGGSAKAFFLDSMSTIYPYTPSVNALMAPSGSQYTGAITFPEPFKSKMQGKFQIRKETGVRKYSHDATPQKLNDWTGATEIFLSTQGESSGSNLGTNQSNPIKSCLFITNYNAGFYKKADGTTAQKDFIFTLVEDQYSGTNQDQINVNTAGSTTGANLSSAINALIRSGSQSGFTWMGRLKKPAEISTPWMPDSGVYKTVQISATDNVVPVNLSAVDYYGMPYSYNRVTTLAACIAKKGTYFQDSASLGTVYCNPYDGENINNVSLLMLSSLFNPGTLYIGTLMFQNIGFLPYALNGEYQSIGGGDFDNANIAFFGCKFYKGAHNVLAMTNKYNCFVFDSVNAYGARDGYNYHADFDTTNDKYSTVIEVNCISYSQGSFNQIYNAENNTNSNNASTAHDGINVLRVGGRYWQSEGPIAGDENCLTIMMGCEAYNFVTSSPSERTSYLIYNNSNNRGPKNPKKFIVDCLGTGVKIRAGVVGTDVTYVLDFVGNTRFGLGAAGTANPLQSITWPEIQSGAWK